MAENTDISFFQVSIFSSEFVRLKQRDAEDVNETASKTAGTAIDFLLAQAAGRV